MAKKITLTQRLLAEALGVFLFVFIGAGAVIATGGSDLLVIAIANGMALGLAITIAMNISGGHINPAVTTALWLTKKISGRDAIFYIVAQLIGALVAGLALYLLYPASAGFAVHYGAPSLGPGVSVLQGIALEAIMTFILVFAVFGTVVDSRAFKIGGFGVGLAVVLDVLAGGPLTGAAMNPARAFGPMVSALYTANWYIYLIGPIIGASVAALLYKKLFLD